MLLGPIMALFGHIPFIIASSLPNKYTTTASFDDNYGNRLVFCQMWPNRAIIGPSNMKFGIDTWVSIRSKARSEKNKDIPFIIASSLPNKYTTTASFDDNYGNRLVFCHFMVWHSGIPY
jgi:hypothetical protein